MAGRPPGVAPQALLPSPIRGFRKVAQGGALGYRASPFCVSPKGDTEDSRKIPVLDLCMIVRGEALGLRICSVSPKAIQMIQIKIPVFDLYIGVMGTT